MALCLSNSGDIAKAVSSYKESLRILKSDKGSIDNAEIARVSYDLAEFYARHWALSDAELYFLDAVKLRTEVFGRQSQQTVQTLHDMAAFYLSCSQYEKAVTVFEDEVSNRRALSGQDDLSVAQCVSALARLYARLGLFSYAHASLAEMKRIRSACAADCSDKEACDSHLSTGIVLCAQGNTQDSSLEFGLAVRNTAHNTHIIFSFFYLHVKSCLRVKDLIFILAGVQGCRVRSRPEDGKGRRVDERHDARHVSHHVALRPVSRAHRQLRPVRVRL
jgi:tetratricopeptide (TPR) repeat protein